MSGRDKSVYFAKLAEQAERYDEMAEHMEAVGKMDSELSVEERDLLTVAYKNAVGSRLAAWRIITSVAQKEKSKGNEEQAKYAKEYCGKVEAELQKICGAILKLLEDNLIAKASTGESKVFYEIMKADYYKYIAEFTVADEKAKASENARKAYEAAKEVAEKDLAATHPIRLGLILSYSLFQYHFLQNPKEAFKIAGTALEDALAEKDDVAEDSQKYFTSATMVSTHLLMAWFLELATKTTSYKDSTLRECGTLIMQLLRDNLNGPLCVRTFAFRLRLLRDNLTLLTSDQEEANQ